MGHQWHSFLQFCYDFGDNQNPEADADAMKGFTFTDDCNPWFLFVDVVIH